MKDSRPKSNAVGQKRNRLRESVRTGFEELLTLLMGRAERDVLVAMAQEIERLLQPLLNPKKSARNVFDWKPLMSKHLFFCLQLETEFSSSARGDELEKSC